MDDFFTLSKLFWGLAAPSNALLFLAILGLALQVVGNRRSGFICMAVAIGGLLVLGLSPLANYVASPLEERFPPFMADGKPVDGIILLGGAEVSDVALARGIAAVNDAADRYIAFAALARAYPDAALISSGLDAQVSRKILADMGVDLGRVRFEDRSRNTAENAAFTKAMVNPAAGTRWLLVTSAFHMPRAMGCFRAAGFPVVANPVDYRTVGPNSLWGTFSRVAAGLDLTDLTSKEWVGLVAYYATGKTSALFPTP